MKTALLVCSACLVSIASPRLFATPEDEVSTALQDFLDQPNYTWSTSESRGMPEENSSLSGEDTQGQHEKNGYTKIWFRTGPHIPPGKPATRPQIGLTDQSDFWASRWVYETPQGWKTLASLPNSHAPVSKRPGTSGNRPLVSIGTSVSVSTRKAGTWRPDLEVAIVMQHFAEVEKISTDTYKITLSPKGAQCSHSLPIFLP